MQSNWQYYIPEGVTIPTDMRVKKGDISVIYRRCSDAFAYEFSVYGTKDPDEIEKAVNEIVNLMVSQSWDHGQEWRVTDMKQINTEYLIDNEYRVDFRIKDSY